MDGGPLLIVVVAVCLALYLLKRNMERPRFRQPAAGAAFRNEAFERAIAPLTDDDQARLGQALGMVLNSYGLLDEMEQAIGVDTIFELLAPHPDSLRTVLALFEEPLRPWLGADAWRQVEARCP